MHNDFRLALTKLRKYLAFEADENILVKIVKGLKKLEYSIDIYAQYTPMTTINPGTPKNK